MKNIFILPAKSFKSKLAIYINKEYTELHEVGELAFCEDDIGWSELWRPQELYITSEEALKPGNWYINTSLDLSQQAPEIHAKKRDFVVHKKDPLFKYCKKIVLTTDSDLIKDAIQAIDNEFLEWFVQNPSCEEAKVETYFKKTEVETNATGHKEMDVVGKAYKLSIPKKESIHTPYTGKVWDPPKQETLEEASEKYWSKQPYNEDAFVEGVKWQQERSYTYEEMKESFSRGHDSARLKGSYKSNDSFEEDWEIWSKQFKKEQL